MKILITIFFVLISAISTAQIKCNLKGEIIGRPNSKVLYLSTSNADYRVNDFYKIDIIDGKFNFSFETEFPQLYELVFVDEFGKGSWRPIKFIAENQTIEFELYPFDEYNKNIIKAGKLHATYKNLIDRKDEIIRDSMLFEEMEKLRIDDKLYSAEFKQWIKAIEKEEDRSKKDSLYKVRDTLAKYTKEAQRIERKIEQENEKGTKWLLGQIEEKQDEARLELLYQLLYEYINYDNKIVDYQRAKKIFQRRYNTLYSHHPIAKKIQLLISSNDIKPGGMFVDFSAPDIDDTMHSLSGLISNKVAVIDLWASWCGPCLRKSKTFVPIYEKYKNRGFTIVGVARENKDTKAMQASIERIGMPWINLVELSDRANIWAKYGAGNSGGKVILVDKQGKIIAIDFDDKELEKHLQKLLK